MKRALLLLLILVLLAAAANVPFALQFIESKQAAWQPTTNLRGAAAAQRGWPSPPPLPWPPVEAWSQQRTFGHDRIDARAIEGNTSTHSMDFDLYGWPLPALEQRQLWWPWDDPKWATSVPSDPGVSLHWSGVLLNPLIIGGGLWVVLVVPLATARSIRRASRLRRRCCPECGYPARVGDACSECGRPLPPGLRTDPAPPA
ncbi:MAG: hypothetical protein KDA22_10660 [Phycisphaerales bacterium]|nr:hypothetical protein [Phycisphaerales bacterium]